MYFANMKVTDTKEERPDILETSYPPQGRDKRNSQMTINDTSGRQLCNRSRELPIKMEAG